MTRAEEARDLFRGMRADLLRAKKLIAGVDEALAVLAKDFSFGESTDERG